MKLGSRLAMILLTLVALLHLFRLIFGVQVTIDTMAVPMWASVVATVVPGTVALLIWRESRATGGAAA